MNTITPRNDTEALLLEKFKPFSPTSIPPVITPNTVTSSTQCLILGDDFLFTAIRQLAAELTAAAKQCPHCKKNGSPQNEDENADDKQQSHQDFPPKG